MTLPATNPADSAAAAFRGAPSHWRQRRPGGPTAPAPVRPRPHPATTDAPGPCSVCGAPDYPEHGVWGHGRTV